MSKIVILAFVAMMAVTALSAPADLDLELELPQDGEPSLRFPRLTCDLASGLGVENSACAAKCIIQGKKGGYCENGACHCR